MNSKPTVFLSHIGEEKALAGILKTEIEGCFLGLVDVFVSSDAQTITLGQNWLDRITSGLRTCKAMLLLCSHASIKRPWLNFEAGAGWARAIEVAPICHSGLRPVELPLPLGLLQGVEASNGHKLQEVFGLIARQLGAQMPRLDIERLVDDIRAFEEPYMVRMRLGHAAAALATAAPELIPHLKASAANNQTFRWFMHESDFMAIRAPLDDLKSKSGLDYSFSIESMQIGGPRHGATGELTIKLSEDLYRLFEGGINGNMASQ